MKSNKRKRILMLVENSFPRDPRVENEAYTLRDAGYQVTVIALTKRKEKKREVVNGVIVYRLPFIKVFKGRERKKRNFVSRLLHPFKAALGYVIEYFYFTVASFFLSLVIAAREGFDVIHAHNPPDTLFLVGAFYKLFGKKFVFDHHDLSPELFLSRFQRNNGVIHSALLKIERVCYQTANMVIATNQSYKQMAIKRGNKKPESVYVVRNGANLNRIRLVNPDPELKKMNRTILGYLGALNPQDGVDYLLRALWHLLNDLHRDDFYCIVIGKGDALEDLKDLSKELKLTDYVHFTGYIPDEDMLRYLSTADICVDPDPSSPLNDLSTWIKIMEYMALGKPIVSFDLKETRFSAQDAAIYVEPNNERKFAEAIALLMDRPDLRKKMGEFGKKRVQQKLAWQHTSKNLIQAYQWLFSSSNSNHQIGQ